MTKVETALNVIVLITALREVVLTTGISGGDLADMLIAVGETLKEEPEALGKEASEEAVKRSEKLLAKKLGL